MIIKFKKICILLFEISLCFLILQQNVFPSELNSVVLVSSVLTGFLLIIINKKIHLNPYLISYTIFLIYICIRSNSSLNIQANFERVLLLLLKLFSSVCIYNYLIDIKKPERFIKLYIFINFISLLIIFLVLGEKAIDTRLGHNDAGDTISYYLFGTPIFKSSNNTASFCAITVLFLLYLNSKKKNKINILLSIFFLIGLLLCGSRKGFLSLTIYLVYILFIMEKNISYKKIVYIFIVPVIMFLVLFKIPIVYNVLGIRIESMMLNLFDVTNSLDGNSFITRNELKNIAIEWIKNKPLFGNGINEFNNVIGNGAENNYLQIMVDFGIVGLIIYYSYLVKLLSCLLDKTYKKTYTSVFIIVVLTIFIHDFGGVTYSWQHMTIWYSIFWSTYHIEKKKKEEVDEK